MPRQIRIEYPGAIYHVLNRGDRREPIFVDDGDCHDFIKTLAEACQKTGFEIHAFCLMKNHFHLVVGTPDYVTPTSLCPNRLISAIHLRAFGVRESVFRG